MSDYQNVAMVSQLPTAESLDGNSMFYVVNGTNSKRSEKTTLAVLANAIGNSGGGTDISSLGYLDYDFTTVIPAHLVSLCPNAGIRLPFPARVTVPVNADIRINDREFILFNGSNAWEGYIISNDIQSLAGTTVQNVSETQYEMVDYSYTQQQNGVIQPLKVMCYSLDLSKGTRLYVGKTRCFANDSLETDFFSTPLRITPFKANYEDGERPYNMFTGTISHLSNNEFFNSQDGFSDSILSLYFEQLENGNYISTMVSAYVGQPPYSYNNVCVYVRAKPKIGTIFQMCEVGGTRGRLYDHNQNKYTSIIPHRKTTTIKWHNESPVSTDIVLPISGDFPSLKSFTSRIPWGIYSGANESPYGVRVLNVQPKNNMDLSTISDIQVTFMMFRGFDLSADDFTNPWTSDNIKDRIH